MREDESVKKIKYLQRIEWYWKRWKLKDIDVKIKEMIKRQNFKDDMKDDKEKVQRTIYIEKYKKDICI